MAIAVPAGALGEPPPCPHRWSKVYFVLWWLVSSVLWVNLFLALILEVQRPPPAGLDPGGDSVLGSSGLSPGSVLPGLRPARLLLGGSGSTPDI